MHSAAFRCGYPVDSSDLATGAAGCLYPFTSPAPAGSQLAAHARPSPTGDSDIPERGELVRFLQARQGAAGGTSTPESHRRRPRLAAHARPGPGRRPGQPRCAASGPSSLPSITGPRGRAAHKCYECMCLASVPLPRCTPSSPAGVDVTPTQIRTSRADVQ